MRSKTTMRLLIYCNKFDESDDLLGFFPKWVYALSNHFEKIFIITQHIGQYQGSDKFEVLYIDKTKSFPYRVLFFYSYLLKLKYSYDSVFFLMAPVWLIVSAPLLKILRKRQILWYAVWKKTFKLKLAVLLSDRIVTSIKEAFPIKSHKVTEVGQGIDIDFFDLKHRNSQISHNKILYLGRISPIKNIHIILSELAKVPDAILDIVGGPVNPGDGEYLERLIKQVKQPKLENRVKFYGRIEHNKIADFYRQADIFVSLTPTGSFDKAMLEAMASGSIVLTVNEGLRKFLEPALAEKILIRPEQLSHKVLEIFSLSEQEKEKIRQDLRNMVVQNHSINSMIPKLAANLKI